MDTMIEIKNRIHDFIDHADERVLKIINAIVESETENQLVPESFYEKLDEEKISQKDIPSKPWDEVKSQLKEKYGL